MNLFTSAIGLVGIVFGTLAPVQAQPLVETPIPPLEESAVEVQLLKVEGRVATVIEEEKEEDIVEVPANSTVYCSCIQTAKMYGVNIPAGHNAWDLKANSLVPVVGQLVLMKYPKTSHVAVIVEITETGYWIKGGNYKHCQPEYRFIPKDYKNLTGFWVDAIYWNTLPKSEKVLLSTSTLQNN